MSSNRESSLARFSSTLTTIWQPNASPAMTVIVRRNRLLTWLGTVNPVV